jgi:hypothetical protein
MNTLVIMKASISSASSVPLRFKGFHFMDDSVSGSVPIADH